MWDGIDKLAEDMEYLYNQFLLEEKKINLQASKKELLEKSKIIDMYLNKYKTDSYGKLVRELNDSLLNIKNEFKSLYDNFDDKLMLFIVGDGNVGKSTLINALVGEEVAKTNALPTTWKIDVYYSNDKDECIIKYKDGNSRCVKVNEGRKIVEDEEHKTKESKKIFNQRRNELLKKVNLKEEREELTRKLSKELIYKSPITEVRWPVKNNWILNECLLVDTPGLNQILVDSNQLGNIQDYYHKADCVLWLLDGQSISSIDTHEKINELEKVLKNVGGIRSNIIGVVNRIDLVQNNSGYDGVKKVKSDAIKYYGKDFAEILTLSAKNAYIGASTGDRDIIKESGLSELEQLIKDIFMDKADEIRNTAKINGALSLLELIDGETEEHLDKIEELEKSYDSKESYLDNQTKQYKDDLKKDIETEISKYLKVVSERINSKIDALSQGEGKEYIEKEIYNIDELSKRLKLFLKTKENEMQNRANLWYKNMHLSEYKYINHMIEIPTLQINLMKNMKLEDLNKVEIFTPYVEEDFFSFLGNIWGKLKFMINKGRLKEKLYNIINNQCNNISSDLTNQINFNISNIKTKCGNELNDSFNNLLMPKYEINSYSKRLNEFRDNIAEISGDLDFYDILSNGDE